ncbi:MAG: DUF1194 domain-containing protein, partial [Candidatus Nitrospinota bacterium M3_3B_026]
RVHGTATSWRRAPDHCTRVTAMPRSPAASIAACLSALPAALALAAGAPARAGPVDLELVLAVDASSSVDRSEFDLQMQGLAGAFRDPKVQAAIEAAGDLGIAVTLVQWSGARRQEVAVPWTRVADAGAAEALAERIATTPRFVIGGGTALGSAMAFALGRFRDNGFDGRRRVIDVSGDGRANQGRLPGQVRDEAVGAGVTVNGVAILNEERALDRYYRDNVIGGTAAFLLTAADYEDFARAIVAKLVRELSGVPVARTPRPPPVGRQRRSAARAP